MFVNTFLSYLHNPRSKLQSRDLNGRTIFIQSSHKPVLHISDKDHKHMFVNTFFKLFT